MANFEKITVRPCEEVVIDDCTYFLVEVPKEELYPSLGEAGDGFARVREDLSKRVKGFVKIHELYHLTDTSEWGCWWGRELRANLIPGMRDPLGLIATIIATIRSKDRLLLYLDRIKKAY